MSAHALLSPSGASRWLACTPSARLEVRFPDTSSEAAAEGTLAHALGEALLRRMLAITRSEKIKQTKEIARIEADAMYTPAMREHMETYATYVLEQYNSAKINTPDAVLLIEQRLDLSEYAPECFGTGDAIIIADGNMTLIDLKYGKGVAVTAEWNKQMMLYGLGALLGFDFLYGITTIEMTIYQPRMDNVSTWGISSEELLRWADGTLRPQAQLAHDGKGDYVPGEHCRFCRAKALCKANADKNLELAKHDFADPALLTDEAVADILSRADAVKKWIAAVEDYALAEAVTAGREWPGYKLVAGRSVRAFSDPDKVAKVLIEDGIDEALIYNRVMLTLTGIEKLLPKKRFDDLLSALIVKPQGKPALVPVSDKRPALNSAESAKQDFSNNQ